MSTLNAALARLFDLLLAPLSGLAPMWGVVIFSVLFGVVVLWIYKKTSNQAKLEQVKRRIHAGLFEIRLFNDSMPAIFRAQGEILRANLHYLALSLVPLAWMIVPLTLVVAQLQFHWGYQGLEPGRAVLLEATLSPSAASLGNDAAGAPQLTLSAPAGVKVEAGPVWSPKERQLTWRISAERAGAYELALEAGGQRITKSLVSSGQVVRRSPIRVGGGFLDQLLYPAEAPLPSGSPVTEITLGYPEAEVSLFGWKTHWLIASVLLSIVVAFALRKPMGVTI